MKVLDIGIEHHFFETLKGLKKDSTACEEYIKNHDYEMLLFEFATDNSNNNKYCMVFI